MMVILDLIPKKRKHQNLDFFQLKINKAKTMMVILDLIPKKTQIYSKMMMKFQKLKKSKSKNEKMTKKMKMF